MKTFPMLHPTTGKMIWVAEEERHDVIARTLETFDFSEGEFRVKRAVISPEDAAMLIAYNRK